MIVGPTIATQVISRLGVEMVVNGETGMAPAPNLFAISAALTALTLLPLLAARRLSRRRQMDERSL